MRILICSGNFFPEKTGIGKYSAEMAAWLAGRGHQVEVITGFPYYPEFKLAKPYRSTWYTREQWLGVSVRRVPHYIPKDGKVSSKRRILIDLTMFIGSSLPWLWLILKGLVSRRSRPDIIVTVCPPLISGVWPWVASKLLGIPWIYHLQDFQVDAAMRLGMIRQKLAGRTFYKLLYALENKLISSATRVSSITTAMCRLAVTKGAAKHNVLLLPNWGDIHNIYPISQNTGFRKALAVRGDQVLVMFAGAMGRKHGLGLVLDAAERLKSDPLFHFVMIGSGSDAEEHRQDADERQLRNMTFLPLQEVEKLNEVLGSADIHLVVQRVGAADLVMPSKLTNILAAGRACIATAEDGTELYHVVHGASTGVAVAPEDVDSLVKAILELGSDPDRRARFGQAARHYAQNHLGKDAILGRFERDLAAICRAPLPAERPADVPRTPASFTPPAEAKPKNNIR
jgi:colanic acid biosynthesis glycosyl transferase WcaI